MCIIALMSMSDCSHDVLSILIIALNIILVKIVCNIEFIDTKIKNNGLL